MKELTPQQENLIQDFAFDLAMVDYAEDMFPPDLGFVREPRRPVNPIISGSDQLCLAAVYDLSVARENRRRVVNKAGAQILNINQLTGV